MKKTAFLFSFIFLIACHQITPPFSYYEKFYGSWKIKEYLMKNDSGIWITLLQDTGRFLFYDALEDQLQLDDDCCKLLILYPQAHYFTSSPAFSSFVSSPKNFEQFYWRVQNKETLKIGRIKGDINEKSFTFKFNDKKSLEIISNKEKEKWILEKI